MSVLCEYPLRDLGGDDPDQHDGDDEAQARSVLEAGAHVRRQAGRPHVRSSLACTVVPLKSTARRAAG